MVARIRPVWLVVAVVAVFPTARRCRWCRTIRSRRRISRRGRAARDERPPGNRRRRHPRRPGRPETAAGQPPDRVASRLRTAGRPEPEIFHRGPGEIFVTEGLIAQCKTDAQLAALLALELAECWSTEALAGPDAHRAERLPPLQSGVGADANSAFGQADGVHAYEMYKYEKEQRQPKTPTPLPDPKILAGTYLTRAGYAPAISTRRHRSSRRPRQRQLERQLVSGDPVRPFAR